MSNLDGLKEVIIDTLYKYMGINRTVKEDYFENIAEEIVKEMEEK